MVLWELMDPSELRVNQVLLGSEERTELWVDRVKVDLRVQLGVQERRESLERTVLRVQTDLQDLLELQGSEELWVSRV